MTKVDDMPGTLGIAEQAILASTLVWARHESDTGRIAWQSGAYRVLSDGDNPRYWTASVRLDRDRVELGAGAGDFGLAKCVRSCERHAQENSDQCPSARAETSCSHEPNRQSRTSEGRSSNNDISPQHQQQSLL